MLAPEAAASEVSEQGKDDKHDDDDPNQVRHGKLLRDWWTERSR